MTTKDVRSPKQQITIHIDVDSFWREVAKVTLLVAGCSLFAVFLHSAFAPSEPSVFQEEGRRQIPQTRSD